MSLTSPEYGVPYCERIQSCGITGTNGETDRPDISIEVQPVTTSDKTLMYIDRPSILRPDTATPPDYDTLVMPVIIADASMYLD